MIHITDDNIVKNHPHPWKQSQYDRTLTEVKIKNSNNSPENFKKQLLPKVIHL